MNMNIPRRHKLVFYATPPHECSYLPEREAATVFVDPIFYKDAGLYQRLSDQGFRRSGEHLYRPYCHNCRDCIAVRVPVGRFQPRRRHRRILQKNADLSVVPVIPAFSREHFRLYCRYLESRHSGGGMDNPSPGGYMQFLTCGWAETWFYEFRLYGQLVAVAAVDRLQTGLSAVYTFFDPALPERSLGVYAVLHEIEEARNLGLSYVYLGYWIEQCRKMSYKNDYQPLEYYIGGIWQASPVFAAPPEISEAG